MKRRLIGIMVLALHIACANAQGRLMRDVFAEAPDSIFPLMTRNNRLDCIDFAENGMAARVRNKLDDWTELKMLTADYLLLQVSDRSTIQMKLLTDSTVCLVHTCCGPAEDSHVAFYDNNWHTIARDEARRPSVGEFTTGEADDEALDYLKALPLMKATLYPDNRTLTWELQTKELTEEQKKAAERYLQPITINLK